MKENGHGIAEKRYLKGEYSKICNLLRKTCKKYSKPIAMDAGFILYLVILICK